MLVDRLMLFIFISVISYSLLILKSFFWQRKTVKNVLYRDYLPVYTVLNPSSLSCLFCKGGSIFHCIFSGTLICFFHYLDYDFLDCYCTLRIHWTRTIIYLERWRYQQRETLFEIWFSLTEWNLLLGLKWW